MPELPEVETVRRRLAPHVEGRRIVGVDVRDARLTGTVDPARVEGALAGRAVAATKRSVKAPAMPASTINRLAAAQTCPVF